MSLPPSLTTLTRVAAVPVRLGVDQAAEIGLVRLADGSWGLPEEWAVHGVNPADAARRGAAQAGFEGEVDPVPIGGYVSWPPGIPGHACIVSVYVLRAELSSRPAQPPGCEWVPLAEALDRIAERSIAPLVQMAGELVMVAAPDGAGHGLAA